MAKYTKKRARELKQDRFRDTTMTAFERLGNSLEGKGKTILYAIGGIVALAILVSLFVSWRARKADEARRALGRAIEIAQAPVTPSPSPGSTTQSFPTEAARAQRAVEEFQKVAQKYGSNPYHDEARYLSATNLLTTDHARGLSELQDLTKSSDPEVAVLAKFAIAQANEADGKYDDAATTYSDLARQNNAIVTPDTANLRLAAVYIKQGKKKEAADLLFNIVDAARKAKDKDGNPLPQTGAAREAGQQLEKVDPERYAQLPPEPPPAGLGL